MRWRRRRGRSVLGHEDDLGSRSVDLLERLDEDGGIVLRQPVPKERVRHPNPYGPVVVRDKRSRLEPRLKAMSVDFGFDSGEDSLPGVAGGRSARA